MAKSDMAKERPWGGNPASQGATENHKVVWLEKKTPLKFRRFTSWNWWCVLPLKSNYQRGWWKKISCHGSDQNSNCCLRLPTIFSQFPRLGLPAVPQRGAGWESCTNRQTLRLPWTDSPGVHGAVGSLEYSNMDRSHLVASHWGFRKQWVSILEWSKDDFGLPPYFRWILWVKDRFKPS